MICVYHTNGRQQFGIKLYKKGTS